MVLLSTGQLGSSGQIAVHSWSQGLLVVGSSMRQGLFSVGSGVVSAVSSRSRSRGWRAVPGPGALGKEA